MGKVNGRVIAKKAKSSPMKANKLAVEAVKATTAEAVGKILLLYYYIIILLYYHIIILLYYYIIY